MTVLLFIGLVLGIWRVTRLLIDDEFPPVRALRDWFVKTLGVIDDRGNLVGGRAPALTEPESAGHDFVNLFIRLLRGFNHSVAYIWTCPWCMSVWAGAVVVALADWRLSVAYPWLVVAIGSLVSGLGSRVDYLIDQINQLLDRRIESDKR